MSNHEFWNEESSTYYFQMSNKELKFTALHPQILDRIKNKPGQKILDFGCGAGMLANQIAKTTEGTVLGVDISEQGIEQAKQIYQAQPNLQFEQIVSSNYQALKDMGPFDIVIISLVIDNLPNEENMASLLNQLFEYTSPNGYLIVGEGHPCFNNEVFTTVSCNLNMENYSQSWTLYQLELFNALTAEKEVAFRVFHYPLETLVKLICRAGFLISDMDEIYDIDDPQYHPEIRKRFNAHLPHFLLIEAMKPNFDRQKAVAKGENV